jgi:maleamate amidohydrolase
VDHVPGFPQECFYDRSDTAHAINLFDMAYKYADVRPVAEIIPLLQPTT